MKQQLIVVDTVAGLQGLKTYINHYDYIAIDTETTSVKKGTEIIGYSICATEHKSWYVVLAKWTVDHLEYDQEIIKESKLIMELLATKHLIMHNAIFDCRVIEDYFKVRLIDALHTDTMILAHLLDENRRVGLKDLGRHMFGEDSTVEQKAMKDSVIANGGKLTKDTYEMYKADWSLLGLYGAKDALLTYRVFTLLVPQLFEAGLDVFFYDEESMPLLKGPTFELNTTGLKIDQMALGTLKNTLKAECAETQEYIRRETTRHVSDKYPGTKKTNTFNIGSSAQLGWLLFDVLQLEFGTLTKGGKEVCKALGLKLPYTSSAKREFIAICSLREGTVYQPESIVNGKKVKAKKIRAPWNYIATDKDILKKLAPRYKWIEKLLELNKKMKILGTYVEGIEERIEYGIIYPSFLQHGTTSGRYSSKQPNFQNLPRDDERVKQCIIARPGKVFVSADYSQLEPRVFAFYSGDTRLMSAFDGSTDFYSVVGMDVFGKIDCTPQKEGSLDAFGVKYKKLRDVSKAIALASAYGATAFKLAHITGKNVEDTQLDMDNYFESFPGVRTMMLEAHDLVKKNGVVTSHFGRPRRIPEAKKITKMYGTMDHAELPYEARSLLNLATNHRIQSTGASIVNRAAIAFYAASKVAQLDSKVVSQVHDELVIECGEEQAEDCAILLQHCMETTNTLPGVDLEAIPRITKTLAKK